MAGKSGQCSNGDIGRRHCIPFLYTRGSHYDVGFDIGRTFSGIIHSFLERSGPLNEEYLKVYETPQGKRVYEDTLSVLKTRMPQYIEELQGTADGAKVPFHKLFLLHLDDITPNVVERCTQMNANKGCTSICVNQPNVELLCHNEDALSEVLNHFYIVSADINSVNGTREKFSSLCYAGHLPGYTMGYNHHGLVYSINTISAAQLRSGKTPRHFLGRAVLSAKNMTEVKSILKDEGCGAADACAVNVTFLKDQPRIFYNIEIGPVECGENSTRMHTICGPTGKNLHHCNRYLHLEGVEEVTGFIIDNSNARMEVLKKRGTVTSREQAIQALGDHSRKDHNVYQENGPDDLVKTCATGIFDCIERTWSLYDDNPKTCQPIVVLPLEINNCKG